VGLKNTVFCNITKNITVTFTNSISTNKSTIVYITYFALNLQSKLRVKYIIYRTVHLLVLIEFVNQFAVHGMNKYESSVYIFTNVSETPTTLILLSVKL
jgi:hypothetical protein